MRILVVEDEHSLRAQLVERLRADGHVVDEAATGTDGLFFGQEYPIDMAVVDLGLPELSGIEIIRGWREQEKSFPVLILTARGRWQDKVEGLEAGADDYLTKPFQFEELAARINALIRRTGGWTTPELGYGPITLDTVSQTVRVAGEIVDLTAYEYRVLACLLQHPGKVMSKTELTEHIYAEDDDRDSNVIEVFVGRLRKKLDPQQTYQPIETLRGRGYRMNPELTSK
jgi:two-component system response regulator PhoP